MVLLKTAAVPPSTSALHSSIDTAGSRTQRISFMTACPQSSGQSWPGWPSVRGELADFQVKAEALLQRQHHLDGGEGIQQPLVKQGKVGVDLPRLRAGDLV